MVDIIDLKTLIKSTSPDATDCGSLGFRLASEHDAILEVTNDGLISVKALTNQSLVGIHEVKFEAYRIDLDPSGLFPKSLDFALQVEIASAAVDPIALDLELTSNIKESLIREAPVMLQNMAPAYYAYQGEKTFVKFDFADPLVLRKEEISDVDPLELQISVESNNLPTVVSLDKVDYSKGTGYGTAMIKIDAPL